MITLFSIFNRKLTRATFIIALSFVSSFAECFVSSVALADSTTSSTSSTPVSSTSGGTDQASSTGNQQTSANAAARILCDVIIFLRGRVGRAMALIAVMLIAANMILGQIDWKAIVTFAVGATLLFQGQSIVYVIMPATMTGINGVSASGKVFNPSSPYTPEEIVSQICPELTNYAGPNDT